MKTEINHPISINEENVFWHNRTIVMYILAVLVLIRHCGALECYPADGTLASSVNAWVSILDNAVTAVAVPLLFILSGVAFFRNYSDTGYVSKLRSRVNSLVVPYLCWNTLGLAFAIASAYTFLSQYGIRQRTFELSVSNCLEAVFHYGCNSTFWFVFDLIIFVLISPLIWCLLKKKAVAIVCILALAVLEVFGIGLPEKWFYRQDAVILYLVGCYIGKYHFNWFSDYKNKRTNTLSLFVLALCAVLLILRSAGIIRLPSWSYTPLWVSYSLSFWFVLCRYVCPKLHMRELYRDSFAVYALHILVCSCTMKLWCAVLPKTPVFGLVNYLLTIAGSLAIIRLICFLMRKYLPGTTRVLFGNR